MKRFHQINVWMLTAALCGCTVAATHAQEQLTREMTLEREYDPTVQDANRVNRLPEVKEPAVTKRPIDYSPFTIPAEPEREITVLPSGDTGTEISHGRRRGYFHFGGGMYANLSGDLGYHIIDNARGQLALYVTHRSTNGNVKFPEEYGIDRRRAKLNDNLVRLDFDHAVGPNATLNLGASYGYTGFNYYGRSFIHPLSSMIATGDTATGQVNQTVAFNFGLAGTGNDRFGYMVGVDFRHFDQKYGWTTKEDGIRENRVSPRFDLSLFLGDASRRIGLAGALDFFDYSYPQFYNHNDSTGYRNRLEATATPYFAIENEAWRLRLGANVMFVNGDSLTVFASPNVSVEARVAERTVFYADALGEIGSNDAYALSRVNRYMDHSVGVRPSRTWLDARLGIRSGIAPGFQLDVFAGYRVTKDATFFIPLYALPTGHDFMSYSAALQTDATRLHAGAAFKYAWRDLVDFSLRGVYNQWTLDAARPGLAGGADMKPYGMPVAELNADLTVRPVKPLVLTLGYYLGAGRYMLGDIYQEVKMKDIHDLNLSGAWNFNDTFGAYLRLNNVLFRQHELIYGYPVQGFNAMAGININF
ncbi:MAG: TonB-dependent receptor [Tannerella sp.]|jgi:hypothetical protein|nr:TonB-dependent receptor [Tannerella sp.]